VETIDPSAYLVAWVVSAPGEDFDDIIEGAAHGLTEEQLQENGMKRVVQGDAVHHHKPDFNKDLPRMLRRQVHKADRGDEIDVHKTAARARMKNPPELSTYQREQIPVLERRWNDVMNLRQLLQKTGVDLGDPLIPRTHMPLGCVVARFRQLRGAVWGTEPVIMDRTMRLNCKGNLHIELDFRPRYFIAIDPLKSLQANDEFEPRTPRAEDLDETDETSALASQEVKEKTHDIILTGTGGQDMIAGRQAMQQNPVELYKKYNQVSTWAIQVLNARRKLVGEEYKSMGKADTGAEEGAFWAFSQIKHYKRRYDMWQEDRERTKMMMDRQVVATQMAVPGQAMKQAVTVTKPQPGQPKDAFAGGMLPNLKVEPWLEEILDGSRFV
jgi:hypothetical protein